MDELDVLATRARRDLKDRVSAMDLTMPAPTAIQTRVQRRRTIRTAMALSVTAVILAVPILASSRAKKSDQLAVETSTTQQHQPSNDAGTPLPSGVPSSSSGQESVSFSCVERYGPETLAKRKFAFDGHVLSVMPAADRTVQIEFSVRRWYRGGQEPRTTVRTVTRAVDSYSSVEAIPITPGMRLLVAGNSDFAWPCGFTQQWSPEAAAVWEQVFSKG